MTRQFVELTFYPGEHSGAHEQNQALTVKVDLDILYDKLIETGRYRDLAEELSSAETELEDVRKGRDEQIEDLESEIDNKDTEIKNLENELDTKEREIDDLQDELRDLKEQVMKLWTETKL